MTGPIGAGGIGEVYRATDTNLKRQVALKVLPAAVAADAERLARFQREAEVLAALSLDHIIVCTERGLRRVLHATSTAISRTHLALDKDAPVSRSVTAAPNGDIVAISQVGGLHHQYERRAA